MTSLEDLEGNIQKYVDYVIYEGTKRGRASTIIDVTNRKKIMKR